MSRRRAGPRVDPIKAFLRHSKRKYLNGVKDHGGFPQQWKEDLHAEFPSEPEAFRAMAYGLIDIAADKVWHEVTNGDDDETDEEPSLPLFIDGIRLKSELRYEADVPGGYLTVLTEHATVAQLFAQAETTTAKAKQAGDAANRQLKAANTALRRAGGRASESLINVKD